MFQTFDGAKLPTPWKNSGENAWSYAELMVNSAWFYADCKLTDGVDTVTTTYLLSRSSQIGDLVKNPDITIRSIYLVSPPHINRTKSWNMSPLTKISVGLLTYEEFETKVEIYEYADGSKCYSSNEVKNDGRITNIKVLYCQERH